MICLADVIKMKGWHTVRVKLSIPSCMDRASLDEKDEMLLEEGATLEDVYFRLSVSNDLLENCLCTVNDTLAEPKTVLRHGDHIIFTQIMEGG